MSMKIINETKFMICQFDETQKIFYDIWLLETINMTEAEIKSETILVTGLIEKYKPKYIISDDTKRLCVYPEPLQNWVLMCWLNACIKVGVLKVAILLPVESLSNISTQQIVDQANEIPYELEYFEMLEDAFSWCETNNENN